MQFRQVRQRLQGRLRLSRWGALFVFAFLVLFERILFWRAVTPSGTMIIFIGTLMMGCLLLGPMPWQWTGSGERHLGLMRGSAQAIAWNALWMAALTGLFLVPELLLGRDPAYPARLLATSRLLGIHPLVLVDAAGLPLIYLVGWFMAEREAAEDEKRDAAERQRLLGEALKETEARVLQAELDPHVLYNALGGLAELVRKDPVATERALLDFSSYYRMVTACARRRTIPLAEERRLLELFLAIEQVRFGDRLQVRWLWPEGCEACSIPPLLLQPVVENAIKHGVAPSEEGGEVRLDLARKGDRLIIGVENEGFPLAETWSPGVGLSNLRKRLENMDPPGSFRLSSAGDFTRAELDLPWEGDQ